MFSKKITVNSVATPNAYPRVQEGLEKFSKLALALGMSAVLAACGSDGDEPSEMLNADGALVDAQGNLIDAEGNLIDADGNVIIVPSMIFTAEKISLEAGESTDLSVRFTDQKDNLITEEIAVVFSSDCISNDGLATLSGDATTNDGTLSVSYTANGCSGEDLVSVAANVGGFALESSTALTIAPDVVSGITASAPEPDQLALRGIGGVETTSVTFTVKGKNQAPVINETVMLSLRPTTGGISFSNNTLVTETSVVTGKDGTATIKVYSGTANAIFRVLAEHAETGNKTESADISVSTGVPVASKFSIALDPFNPPADNTNGVEVDVSIIASDQYGNSVTDGTRVNFVSPESGNIDSSCVLENARCSVTWISNGARGDWRSSIIAYTDGAEDFDDVNQNNVFDGSDVAGADLPEPYADENENGSYDSGEFFVDFNANGVRDLGDGIWNGPCLDSVDQSAVCEGAERIAIAATHLIVNASDVPAILESGDFGSPGSTIQLAGPLTLAGLLVSDEHGVLPSGNSMPVGTTLKFTTTNGKIDSGANFTVPGNQQNGQRLALNMSPDTTSSNGVLTLTVTPPNGAPETAYTWVIED